MLYAAYGSNLDPTQMAGRCPHSPQRGTGWAVGWRITFGGEGWDGALPTLAEEPEDQVFVALYDVTSSDETALDQWESADTGLYRKLRVRVATLDGELTCLGLCAERLRGRHPERPDDRHPCRRGRSGRCSQRLCRRAALQTLRQRLVSPRGCRTSAS